MQRLCKPSAMKLASIAEVQPILSKETVFSLSAMLAKNKGQPPIKRTVLYS